MLHQDARTTQAQRASGGTPSRGCRGRTTCALRVPRGCAPVAPRSRSCIAEARGARWCRCRAVPDAAPSSAAAGRASYNPATYQEMVGDAVRAVLAARADGNRLLEVEFPPRPGGEDAYKGSSDEFIDANIQLAMAAAKLLTRAGLRVQIVLPDATELLRAEARFRGGLALLEGVSLGALGGSRRGELAAVSDFFFGKPAAAREELTSPADVYLAINASTVELVALEAWWGRATGAGGPAEGQGATLVAWNLELDTARGDLGLPAFPSRRLHWAFLSRFRPAFFLRQRDYSKTVAVPPYLLNYSGATFREYPGPWQVLLRSDDGTLACIAERGERYPLGEAKEELLASLGLNTEPPGSLEAFLRRGVKNLTWWEEGGQEERSAAWRS